MSERNPGLVCDPLFVAVTRPPMRWGVTFSALLMNMVFTMEVFLLTKNLLTLLVCVPIHGLCALLCLRDARYFDLVMVWTRTSLRAYTRNVRIWKGSGYSALTIDLPRISGRRLLLLDAPATRCSGPVSRRHQ